MEPYCAFRRSIADFTDQVLKLAADAAAAIQGHPYGGAGAHGEEGPGLGALL